MTNPAPPHNVNGAFDAHNPPSLAILDKCVHCGFCLPACPTYALWGEEMDSPRGRIYLMKLALEGKVEMNAKWVGHFDSCLGCVSCMTACPSGVDYGKLIEATRAQIERNFPRPARDKLHRRFLFQAFTRPEHLKLLRRLLLAYQETGLQSLLRYLGFFRLLPKPLAAMDSLVPPVPPPESILPLTPAQGEKRMRVGLLLGCVQRSFFSDVNAATARVLAAEGCEVVAPPDQSCCGALCLHTGEESQALQLARKMIDTFENASVEVILINAAGCGSAMKDYGYLLRDDPAYARRARLFSAKCKDISEFLCDLSPLAPRNPLRVRVAYHDACHLQHAQGIRSQPRTLLQQIPDLQLLEIPEGALCCGSAGVYNLIQPEAATELGDRKANHIAALKPDLVVTGNPGCILQLRSSLARAGHPLPVLHTMQLLDASLRGLPRSALR